VDFSYDTARYFVEKYSWYNITPILQKYFNYGPEIIKYSLFLIGNVTEETKEASHKRFLNIPCK